MKHVLESKEIAGSPNYQTTRFDTLVSWVQAILQKTGADKPLDWAVNASRANSLWPMPFGTACCAIEYMATAASKFDLARFGMERQSFSPRQADLLICAGRVPFKLAPVLRRIWMQMPQPKWAISMGACASSGGMYSWLFGSGSISWRSVLSAKRSFRTFFWRSMMPYSRPSGRGGQPGT
ncbi:MAG TPA: NADH-quinone oxidoreductase subunit NuoB [Gemmatimonadales bacterium]|nr:NADH-quinone oxidoreductase subunit NuoB [Gemmatimonadales bacterium]